MYRLIGISSIEGIFNCYVFLMIIVTAIHFYRKKKGIARYSLFTKAIMTYYFLILFNTAIFGFKVATGEMLQDIIKESRGYSSFQFIPFFSIRSTYEGAGTWEYPTIQIIGSILLLFPLAYSMRILKDMSAKKVFITCLIINVGIEFIQMMTNIITRIPSHWVNIDDIILNMTGVVLALLVAKVTYKFKDYFLDILFVYPDHRNTTHGKISKRSQEILAMLILYFGYILIAWVVSIMEFPYEYFLNILLFVFTIGIVVYFIISMVLPFFSSKLKIKHR
ncbi:VanZ like family protein [Kandleria vitulina]|uniref:VanZ family protein n=1 Tax=Kandleria vitulina TaxID=1630 RepID=UPI000888A1A4|nr:VanZ family protein [Kandleria vitulina]SDL40871.1 VanZ like family protein [Kandleria vitulina]